jgi:hypothetical protein
MLIHQQNSHAPRGKQRTGRREAQSCGPGLHSRNIPCIMKTSEISNYLVYQSCFNFSIFLLVGYLTAL